MKYSIEIASVPNRERLVAEIWDNDQMIAEINQEKEELEVVVYFNKIKQSLELNYDAFLLALREGKEKLLPPTNPPQK